RPGRRARGAGRPAPAPPPARVFSTRGWTRPRFCAIIPPSCPVGASPGGGRLRRPLVSAGEIDNPAPVPGQLGRYQILGKLGRGGMAGVSLAHDAGLDRRVALKLLPRGSVHAPDAVARFRREARALAKLSHPGIVQAYDSDAADGRHFLVMEYVEGHSLNALL